MERFHSTPDNRHLGDHTPLFFKRTKYQWLALILWCALWVAMLLSPLMMRQAEAVEGAGGGNATPAPQISAIEPAFAQPGSFITLTFSGKVWPRAVSIAGQTAEFLDTPTAPVSTTQVLLPQNTPAGSREVRVQLAGADGAKPTPVEIRKTLWVMPVVTALQSGNSVLSKNQVVAGQAAEIQLSDNFPTYKQAVVTINATPVPAMPDGKRLLLTIPATMPPGEHQVKVKVGNDEWLDQPIIRVLPHPGQATVTEISPRLLRPETRMIITGQNLQAPVEQVTVLVGGAAARVLSVDPGGTKIYAEVREGEPVLHTPLTPKHAHSASAKRITPGGTVEVRLWDVPVSIPDTLQSSLQIENSVSFHHTLLLIGASLAVMGAIVALIAWLYSSAQSTQSWMAALLLEPENNTYSLSRAQFFWWSFIVAFGYIFLFLGRGFIEGRWEFPSLSGFGIAFLISLGTLVAAQATSASKGVKGAGNVHPSPADLVVHGGVLAPERAQQVAWSIIAGAGFLTILIETYASRSQLPPIPDELLYLMGISSAGYIGGKLTRKAGPIIRQVEAQPGSVQLKITGDQLSKDAVIWVDNTELPQDWVSVLASDPASPEFAKTLLLSIPAGNKLNLNQVNDWVGLRHTLTVVNPDLQRAEWWAAPDILKVDILSTGAAGSQPGDVTLSIQAEHIDDAVVWEAQGAQVVSATRDAGNPLLWTMVVRPAAGRNSDSLFDSLIAVNPDGRRGEYTTQAPLKPTTPVSPETDNPNDASLNINTTTSVADDEGGSSAADSQGGDAALGGNESIEEAEERIAQERSAAGSE